MKTSLAFAEWISREFGIREISLSKLEGVLADLASSGEAMHPRDLAARLTVQESHFFRHREQIHFVASRVRERLARGEHTVVWSAGCCRGEEPYSLAICLVEQLGPSCRAGIELVGTDFDAQAIAQARSGLYGPWSLRGVSPMERETWFVRHDDDRYRLSSDLQSWLRCYHLSIQEHLRETPSSSVDVILFRNVAIYFSQEAIDEIHEGFVRVLKPDGLLVQAPADPEPMGHRFKRLPGDVAAVFAPSGARDSAAPPFAVLAEPSHRLASPGPSCRRPLTPRPMVQASVEPPERRRTFEHLLTLADRGEVHEVIASTTRILVEAPREQWAYTLRALACLHMGDTLRVLGDLRAALFLSPDDHYSRYLYVVALLRAELHTQAGAQARALSVGLRNLPDDMPLADRRTTVRELREAMKELCGDS